MHAHPGGLNKEGCHNNRKTGDYHCHRGHAQPAPTPISADAARTKLRGQPQTERQMFANCAQARAAGAAPVKRG
ncbi:YHYH domain-containing protein, partial [Planococcus sp. SIMBA_160]